MYIDAHHERLLKLRWTLFWGKSYIIYIHVCVCIHVCICIDLESETSVWKWSNVKFKSDVIVSRKVAAQTVLVQCSKPFRTLRESWWKSACSKRYCVPLFQILGFSKHLLFTSSMHLCKQHPLSPNQTTTFILTFSTGLVRKIMIEQCWNRVS